MLSSIMKDSPRRPASYRAIARRAGVSVATVSLAMNHHPRIPAATRQKVVRIAQKLAYVPKTEVAKVMGAIRRQRQEMETLALVTNWAVRSPWKSNPYMRQFHEVISRRALELGYQIEEFWMNEPGMNPKRLTKILHARNIPGMIIPPAFVAGKRLPFDVSGVAVASHGRIFFRPELNRVEPDSYFNVLLALKELRKLGYHRIGLVCFGGSAWNYGHQIEGAYFYWQSRGGMDAAIPPFLRDDYETGQDFWEWFKTYKVDCILTGYPLFLQYLRNAGVDVPAQTGFACIGVIPEIGDCAGINIRPDLIDAALVDMVIGQIALGERGIPKAPRATIIEGVWQPGGTLRKLHANMKE